MPLPRPIAPNKRVFKRLMKVALPNEADKFVVNRNPRNLEFLRIAHKPKGYALDEPFSKEANYWHKLEIIPSAKYITAQLVHFKNGPVIEASTKEWCIKKHLFRTSDTAAYVNLARIFAQRCLEAGIIEMTALPLSGVKIEKFYDILKENGLVLQEPEQIDAWKSNTINKYVGRKMTPEDWKEIVEHH